MFLHLGNDISVRFRDIVSIHDYGIFRGNYNKQYMKSIKESVILALEEGQEKKSLVITENGAYISAISPLTLKRRIMQLKNNNYL